LAYSLVTFEQTKSPIAEAYRTLRTNVQFTCVDSDTRKIMITSPGPREGKTTTVANLAVSMAQAGKTVLIIDADLRNPTQHKLFGLDNAQGLSVALVQDKGLPAIYSGNSCALCKGSHKEVPSLPNPAELIGSKRMEAFAPGSKRAI